MTAGLGVRLAARAGAVACALALGASSGCIVHRGPGWRPASERGPVELASGSSLVIIGNPGVPGSRAALVAERVAQTLSDERAAGRRPIVLFLGDLVLPAHPRRRASCADPKAAWTRPGSRELRDVVRAHLAAGGQAFAVLGPTDRACGHDVALRQADPDAGPHPWAMPDDHYVLRIAADGTAAVASSCDDAGCKVVPPRPGDLLELLVADATAWLHPPPPGTAARARADQSVRRLDALVQAATRGETGPPRILVGSVPVEAAGMYGHGGRTPEASFHNLPDSLRAAVAAGRFAGSIGAYDHALYVEPDLTDAIKRADRTWVRAPIFQIVSGAASWPDSRPGAWTRRLRYFRGDAYLPAVASDHLGFAVLRTTRAGDAQAELQARRRGRWEIERIRLQLHPRANPVETASPSMAPCLRCPQIEASQRQ